MGFQNRIEVVEKLHLPALKIILEKVVVGQKDSRPVVNTYFEALKWVMHMHIVNAIRDGHIAVCDAREYANAYVDCYLRMNLKTRKLLVNNQE